MAAPRRLLSRLRDLRATGAAPLSDLVRLVSAELVSEVCSVYVHRPGDLLELAATQGLNPNAVGHTRLRVGANATGRFDRVGELGGMGRGKRDHRNGAQMVGRNLHPHRGMGAEQFARGGKLRTDRGAGFVLRHPA